MTEDRVVTEHEELKIMPAPDLVKECLRPFNGPPKTYGDALERDAVWLCAYERCALQIMGIREEYGLNNTQKLLCIDTEP